METIYNLSISCIRPFKDLHFILRGDYDHPYFGQLFLAAMLSIVGYPDSLHPSPDVKSIEMLHMVPRVLMGLLAMADTFLVYKIAERRYNNRMIGFISATLFAVMPITWLFRRIMLDS